jgi:hypothetical protein
MNIVNGAGVSGENQRRMLCVHAYKDGEEIDHSKHFMMQKGCVPFKIEMICKIEELNEGILSNHFPEKNYFKHMIERVKSTIELHELKGNIYLYKTS